MSERWLNENREQFLSGIDSLLAEAQHNGAELSDARVQQLLASAQQQHAAVETTLATLADQRHALLQTLDQLQQELAVAGRPLRGEVS